MSETRFHGARVTESTDLVTAINDVDSSVIGIVATADDADAKLFAEQAHTADPSMTCWENAGQRGRFIVRLRPSQTR
ncbi:Major tail sheath protein FI [Escherichia coli]|nr:Major tail sheath protein FI [Escherichia coli]